MDSFLDAHLQQVMNDLDLGPNGGLTYCMEYLLAQIEWLEEKLRELCSDGLNYILFDCPGQVCRHFNSTQEVLQLASQLFYSLPCRLSYTRTIKV
jgi:cellulose biosynthesis protein BcsQ